MNEVLARRVLEVAHLEGQFTLRSGATATEYFDKYQFEADPVLLRDVTRELVPLLPTNTELLAGLELGGVPLVTMVSQHTGLPLCLVRKQAKQHGTGNRVEGAGVSGRRTVIVEDVVTSGAAILDAVDALQMLGAEVSTAVCVIDREAGAAARLRTQGVALHALLKKSDLETLQAP
jgi:orotate phosphoribosyltransferase